METKELNRFSPLFLKRGRPLRNRVVVPPMASQTADSGGFVTARTLEHYQRLSESGAGLIIAEYTYVHSSGKSEKSQLSIESDAHVEGLRALANQIRYSGALVGIQITHAGGKSERGLTGGHLMGPSAIVVPVKDRNLEVPDPMTIAQIDLWKAAFLSAVDRAALAGFDLVEFHAAHGYGLNQWLSPLTNKRDDEYGRDFKGRARLLLEIVSNTRKRHPQLALSVRIPGQDFMDGGLQVEDSIALVAALEESGVDLIHVSSGIGGWRRPRDRGGEGYLVGESAIIQANVTLPVIGVGGIETGAYIDESLTKRRFSLAAVGRAILHDPKSWGQLHLNKFSEERTPFQQIQRGWALPSQQKGKNMNTKMIAAGAGMAANSVMLISQLGVSALPMHPSQSAMNSKTSESVVVAANEDALTLEESFLRVPQSCKDRTFSFAPTPVGREAIPESVLHLHNAMSETNA